MNTIPSSVWFSLYLDNMTRGPMTFPVFNLLIVEIRLAIWIEVCSERRVLPLLPGEGFLSPISRVAVPAVLQVCRESRREGLRHYRLDLHENVYFNPRSDIIMLHVEYPRQRIDPDLYRDKPFDFSVVRTIAVVLEEVGVHSSLGVSKSTQSTGLDSHLDRPQVQWKRFGDDFVRDIRGLMKSSLTSLKEIVLLALPPLTARPNLVSQRITIVEGAPKHLEAETYMTESFHQRAVEVQKMDTAEPALAGLTLGADDCHETIPLPNLTLRFALCDPFVPPPDQDGTLPRYGWLADTSHDATQRHIGDIHCHFYGDQGLGFQVVWDEKDAWPHADPMASEWWCFHGYGYPLDGDAHQRKVLRIRSYNETRSWDPENW
ncbi:hypothetical protein GGR53DRAFT_476580 [Hypoxylon sp. FL1150]|nr:hypothetical protein GGR53DRAFT_476580 [Hypoxylon sp. FL1150]